MRRAQDPSQVGLRIIIFLILASFTAKICSYITGIVTDPATRIELVIESIGIFALIIAIYELYLARQTAKIVPILYVSARGSGWTVAQRVVGDGNSQIIRQGNGGPANMALAWISEYDIRLYLHNKGNVAGRFVRVIILVQDLNQNDIDGLDRKRIDTRLTPKSGGWKSQQGVEANGTNFPYIWRSDDIYLVFPETIFNDRLADPIGEFRLYFTSLPIKGYESRAVQLTVVVQALNSTSHQASWIIRRQTPKT